MDGVVATGEGLLWSGGWVFACLGQPRFVYGRWGWLRPRASRLRLPTAA